MVPSNQSILAKVAILLTQSKRCASLQARRLQFMLPEIMTTVQYGNMHITVKALAVFKNAMAHLEKTEASPIALALADRLLPLFDDVRPLWVTEPCRWALRNGIALQPRPVGSTRAGPSAHSAPLGSRGLSSGL